MENIILIIIGVAIIILGIINITGNISTIHYYQRRKVKEEDVPKYGKWIGSGTVVVGFSIAIIGILLMILKNENIYYYMIPGIVIGLIMMLYAQFKYNRGIF